MRHLTPTGQNGSSLFEGVMAVRQGLYQNDYEENDLNTMGVSSPETPFIAGELSTEFAMQDPDLVLLHKDMKSAAAQLTLAKKSGQLFDMAQWRLDSAQSAYQTRLIEVRKNKFMASMKATTPDQEKIAEKRAQSELAMQEKMNEQFAALRKKRLEQKRKKDEGSNSWMLYFLIGLWMANMARQNRMQMDMNSALQNSFSKAKTKA